MQKVIISILNFNSGFDTIECLRSIQKLRLINARISTYVLDNGSTKRLEIDAEKFEDIDLHFIRSEVNYGFTGGHNLIFEKVKNENYDFLLLLNNDCILEKDSVEELILTANKNGGCVVPKIYFTKGREYHKAKYKKTDLGKVIWYAGGKIDWENVMSVHLGLDEVDRGQYAEKKEITFATGACLLLQKKIIDKTGLFDNRYFLYYEDADLSMRIIQSGFRIFYQPKALVWHSNAGSSGSGSDLHDYYLTRNRLLFGIKYAPVRTKIALIRESIRHLRNGRKWQKIGARDYFLKKFEKGSYEI